MNKLKSKYKTHKIKIKGEAWELTNILDIIENDPEYSSDLELPPFPIIKGGPDE